MQTLLVKFALSLKDSDIRAPDPPNGPLFHRWLPDGEKDAVTLEMTEQKATLKLWFERTGFVRDRWIVFDNKRREIEEETMTRQAILDAGSLQGLLEMRDLSAEDVKPILEDNTGHDGYVALGKRAVIKLICPPVSRLINILRTNYGQYWIQELEEWDSRKYSLGHYYRLLKAKCSVDGGGTWMDFLPNKPTATVTLQMSGMWDFDAYITKQDWEDISRTLIEGYEPSPAAFVLSKSHRLLRQGDLKYAIIEGVTALELAVHEFIRIRLGGKVEPVNAFLGLKSEAAQLAVIAATLGRTTDLEPALKCIATRHKIVHEGFTPTEDARAELIGLLNTVSAMLEGPRFRFPTANPGNQLSPPEEWERQYQSRGMFA
jgi:hypothetical protein